MSQHFYRTFLYLYNLNFKSFAIEFKPKMLSVSDGGPTDTVSYKNRFACKKRACLGQPQNWQITLIASRERPVLTLR